MEEWKIGDGNKSDIYILPMLGLKSSQFFNRDSLPQSQYINCFIGDSNKNINNKILLLYKFHSSRLYLNFEVVLQKHDLYDYSYETDNSHTMFVFNIPDKYLNDYNKILKGKYSTISDIYKEHIISFHSLSKSSETFGILYKTNNRREQLELDINEGLPRFNWTKIPDNVELESLFDNNIEIFKTRFIETGETNTNQND